MTLPLKTGERICRALNLWKRLPKISPPVLPNCATMSRNWLHQCPNLFARRPPRRQNTVFDAVDNARQKISDTASKAQDRVAGARTDLETTIERNPLVAVLIAMVAGILVGLLSRGRKWMRCSTGW
jgi:hypothetical protein